MQNNFPESPFTHSKTIKVVLFGDVIGSSGQNAVCKTVQKIKTYWNPDLIIVNGENADGFGMLPDSGKKMLKAGVDIITGGNHTFRPKAVLEWLDKIPNVIRPLNLVSSDSPGRGYTFFNVRNHKICIINLSGQVFMDSADSPFRAIDKILNYSDIKECSHRIVDFHAEATGEKVALGYYLSSRASLVVGTHTHVQTADEKIFPGGCGYISDLGMCGAIDSIIGMSPESIIRKYTTGIPGRFNPAGGIASCEGVIAELSEDIPGKCLKIQRIKVFMEDYE
ncbi:MAG: TIGR00282 family metallophosphoesterase [Deltaproteobacteria bacterium]|nr:TIGR00282 family metallophosphoesterase [Deltaproteobacteria bacterium]